MATATQRAQRAQETQKTDEQVLIKKYGNRRLYDTTQSKYITLDDLSAIVKSGATVKVIEASTERDLTRQVLTQVILEQQEALDMFPVELLHMIIRIRGTLDQAPFTAFLATVTRQFFQGGNLWAQQMATIFGGIQNQGQGEEPATAQPSTIGSPFALNSADKGSADEQPSRNEGSSKDLSNLKQRMDNLLGKLGKDS